MALCTYRSQFRADRWQKAGQRTRTDVSLVTNILIFHPWNREFPRNWPHTKKKEQKKKEKRERELSRPGVLITFNESSSLNEEKEPVPPRLGIFSLGV